MMTSRKDAALKLPHSNRASFTFENTSLDHRFIIRLMKERKSRGRERADFKIEI